MFINMLMYVDTDNGTIHFIDSGSLKANLVDCAGELLRVPTSKNIDIANKLLDFYITVNNSQDN